MYLWADGVYCSARLEDERSCLLVIMGADSLLATEKAKGMLHDQYLAPTKEEALKAFGLFFETFGAKYPKAVGCLVKDKDDLFTFYDFPVAHWMHLRTTNPIESTFATVRLRHCY